MRPRALTIDRSVFDSGIPWVLNYSVFDSGIEEASEKLNPAGRAERFAALFVSDGYVVLIGDTPDSDF